MPEGPEHYFASKFINESCKDLIFYGEVKKSELANHQVKHPNVEWNDEYQITALSRGKEVKLTLSTTPSVKCFRTLSLVFQFGMSGSFKWFRADEISKHAHLRFFSKNGTAEKGVLCFHDPRRFGKWRIGNEWGADRGPDIVDEYSLFRCNVLNSLTNAIFKRPICETLLNQKYFNGVGNYLRAEILYRAGIQPFVKAKDVLENYENSEQKNDILHQCFQVMQEAIELYNKSPDYTYLYSGDDEIFTNWVQCYNKPNMKSLQDHQGRTIWFQGDPGPLVPKNGKNPKTKIGKKEVNETKKSKPKTENLEIKDVQVKVKENKAEVVTESGYFTRSRSKKGILK